MKFEASNDLLSRARRVIPSATQTFSKGPNQWARGVTPYFLERGDGAWVWDADGNRFLDHLMALGPIILGYNNPAVNDAIRIQLEKGTVFSQMNALEPEVAEMLVARIPGADMVRFGKSGSDATAAAIRAARAATGREHVAICGYHGWHDWYIGSTTRDLGVPSSVKSLTHGFTYNDLDSLEQIFDTHPGAVAAVMMEAIGVDEPQPGFLENVQQLAGRHGAVLIFDEIVTGFRLEIGGAQARYGVIPDLSCYGKAMANGMPLSAVVGRRDIMEIFDDIFFSGTFGGETLSLAACKATITEMESCDAIFQIDGYGSALLSGLRNLIDCSGLGDAVRLRGYGARSIMEFPHLDEHESRVRRTYVMQECVKRGLLYFGVHMPTAAHGKQELDFTLSVMSEVLPLVAAAYQANDFTARLDGEAVEQIFRKA